MDKNILDKIWHSKKSRDTLRNLKFEFTQFNLFMSMFWTNLYYTNLFRSMRMMMSMDGRYINKLNQM